MGSAPRIEARNLCISELFKEFYSVPDFQREYVWSRDNVLKLLEDIEGELYDDDMEPSEDTEYFLGSIVVFRDEYGVSQLIDGQQRLTTIYVSFCVIRDFLKEFGINLQSIGSSIAGHSQDPKTGDDISQDRLTLQYGDGAKVLKLIVEGKDSVENINIKESASAQRLVEAYQTIREFLEERFGDNSERVKQFSVFFANKVRLIRIETPNLKNALKVFETINDRGIGLTSIDLLKNYLFINISNHESINPKIYWEKLKEKWDKLIKILYECNEEPMQFLRYYIMSHYEIDLQNSFPEEAVYEWLVSNQDTHKINQDPFGFVDRLIDAGQFYSNFTNGKNIDGSPNQYLINIKKLHGKYRQHYVILLAGRGLSKELFTELCRQVENLLFVYIITRSTRKDVNITRIFSQWSRELRKVCNIDDFNIFIEKYFKAEISSFSYEFEMAFQRLGESAITKLRIKYIMAKLAQYIDGYAYGNLDSLEIYLNKLVTIEHILPQTGTGAIEQSFDKPAEYSTYVQCLGNLTLLEKTINSSLANKPFLEKINGYKGSRFLITRSLVEKLNIGINTQLNRAIKELDLSPFDVWDSKAIEKRQTILTKIAKRVWGVHS